MHETTGFARKPEGYKEDFNTSARLIQHRANDNDYKSESQASHSHNLNANIVHAVTKPLPSRAAARAETYASNAKYFKIHTIIILCPFKSITVCKAIVCIRHIVREAEFEEQQKDAEIAKQNFFGHRLSPNRTRTIDPPRGAPVVGFCSHDVTDLTLSLYALVSFDRTSCLDLLSRHIFGSFHRHISSIIGITFWYLLKYLLF
jgi:hypothetical protein